ncbi:hypothetical protein XaplCFBP3123_06545 [Xanthomonas arboricola pv. populi]|nr:hypothetical protein XaplCFBP3123_06545 [Xanthomonas arboricola pv. populi]
MLALRAAEGGAESLALLPGLSAGSAHRLQPLHRGPCGDFPIDGGVLPTVCGSEEHAPGTGRARCNRAAVPA